MEGQRELYSGDIGQRYSIEIYTEEVTGTFPAGWRPVAYTNVEESAHAVAQSMVLRLGWTRSRIWDRQQQPRKLVRGGTYRAPKGDRK